MKIFITVLKVLLMLLTGAVAIFLGIFGALSVIMTSQESSTASDRYVTLGICWMAISVIFYIVPTFLVIFKKYKIAGAMSIAGMIGLFIMYGTMYDLGGYQLYLPLIFNTIVTVLIAFFGNWDNIHQKMLANEMAKKAEAPSVLGGTTKFNPDAFNEGKKSKKKK